MKRRDVVAAAGGALFGVRTRRAEARSLFTIYFESGLADPGAGPAGGVRLLIIRQATEAIRALGVLNVIVRGYADTVGGAACNLLLSERRAEAVRRTLLQEGVQATIVTQALGKTQHAVRTPDNTPEVRNRRVVIIID